jgi:hypothetical protein
MSEPLPPVGPEATQEVLLVAPARRVQNPTIAVVVLVTAVFLVVAAMLAIIQLNSQDSLSSIQNNQSIGLSERSQLTDVVCVIWEGEGPSMRARLPQSEVAQANQICAALKVAQPQPTLTAKPSPAVSRTVSPSKG